nr:hypothetical protein [Tanacetum cinerariifolium]
VGIDIQHSSVSDEEIDDVDDLEDFINDDDADDEDDTDANIPMIKNHVSRDLTIENHHRYIRHQYHHLHYQHHQ